MPKELRGAGSPGAQVRGGCEGAGNLTQVLCKSTTCF